VRRQRGARLAVHQVGLPGRMLEAAEGERFASKVEEMHKVLGALKPGEVEATRKALKEFGGFDT